jgi:hypothetical protein
VSPFPNRQFASFRILRSAGLFIIVSLACSATTIDFEQFTDSQALTTQIPGLTFSNTSILTAGISLNELEFPPHSGTNVAFDSGGPIGIKFSSPVTSFSGYFTFTEPLSIVAYNAANSPVAQVTSPFSSNLAISGDPGSTPNEFLSVTSAGGFNSVLLTGDPAGGSFVMDDISYVYSASASVPEPAFLLLAGLLIFAVFRQKYADAI